MKRIISIILFIIVAITMQAQRFEWAKNIFGGMGEKNKIDFSATDSEGNLYILGTCGTGAEIDNNTLVEVGGSQRNLILLKLNTEGILLWKKTIGANNGQDPAVNCMRLIGDSVVVVMARVSLATYSNYLYYLDTLINKTQVGYPVDSLPTYPFVNNCGGGDCNGTVFLEFNLNGGLIEQHFLQTRYIDSVGNEVPYSDYLNYPITESFCTGDIQPFNIDNNGNIYILKSEIYGWGSMTDSNIKRYRILIDEERQFDVGRRLDLDYSPVLLKFTPHFNDLLWAKYMIRDTVGRGDNPSKFMPYVTGMTGDNGGNIYVSGYIEQDPPRGDTTYYRDLILDSNNITETIRLKQNYGEASFLIKYDSNGNVIYSKQLKSNIDYTVNYEVPIMSVFNGIVLNDSSNSIFILCSAQKNYFNDTSSNNSQFVIDDNNINVRNNVLFLRLNKDNGDYISYGKVKTPYTSAIRG